MDYPRSDRHLLEGVRRLTRIDARSLEQVTSLDHTDDIYNWPMLYGVEVGHWDLPQDQADQLRDYLLRGGFLMVDDFHADQEWATFMDSLERVLPDRPVVDLPNSDPIFHTIYDLNDRVQIPGAQYLQTGRIYEKDESGRPEHWRAVYDDKNRIIVAICHNMDLGDAWEWSDDPRYSGKVGRPGLPHRDELLRLRSHPLKSRENRQVALGSAILQNPRARLARLRPRPDRVQRSERQARARSPHRRHVAHQERQRRVSSRDPGAE